MKFKLNAWMIYFLGFPVVYGISIVLTDPLDSLSLVVEYALWGIIVLGVYYLTRRLWFGNQSHKKINNSH
jgi:multidrug transporter EmrE-like cation transporter